MVNKHTRTEWFDKIERSGFLCYWCGTSLLNDQKVFIGTKDHVTPLSRGGDNSLDNVVPACDSCNRNKHSMTKPEFIAATARGEFSELRITPLSLIPSSMSEAITDLAKRRDMNRALGLPGKKRRA